MGLLVLSQNKALLYTKFPIIQVYLYTLPGVIIPSICIYLPTLSKILRWKHLRFASAIYGEGIYIMYKVAKEFSFAFLIFTYADFNIHSLHVTDPQHQEETLHIRHFLIQN